MTGLPYRTVLNLLSDGVLGYFPAGRYYRIPDEELQRLLREVTEKAAAVRNAA